jgi:hypothetical protein
MCKEDDACSNVQQCEVRERIREARLKSAGAVDRRVELVAVNDSRC